MRHLQSFVKLFTSHGAYYALVHRLLLLLLRALSIFLHYSLSRLIGPTWRMDCTICSMANFPSELHYRFPAEFPIAPKLTEADRLRTSALLCLYLFPLP